MIFIGDVHGRIIEYEEVLATLGDHQSIQVGDMGVGFPKVEGAAEFVDHDLQHRFIRGNHDNPEKAMELESYLGDYGHLEDHDLYYVSGGRSIDRHNRREHIDWWEAEELSYKDMNLALEEYRDLKPTLVVTHEAPTDAVVEVEKAITKLHGACMMRRPSFTAKALQMMFDYHEPDIWIFGHYHMDIKFQIGRTDFRCLDELSICGVD